MRSPQHWASTRKRAGDRRGCAGASLATRGRIPPGDAEAGARIYKLTCKRKNICKYYATFSLDIVDTYYRQLIANQALLKIRVPTGFG